MHLIVESLCGPYACYAPLEQPHFGCARPYYDVTSRKYSSVSLIMVLVSSTELVSRKSSFDMSVYDASWQVPIGKPITNSIQWTTYWCTGWSYVSWDTRLIVAIVFIASWRVPIGKPIANSVQWKTYWCTGWSYVSWDTGLIVGIVFMSTQPAGGCHELLLGCYLNPLLSWSKLGSILIALACRCVNQRPTVK